jgi:hypothetical protein
MKSAHRKAMELVEDGYLHDDIYEAQDYELLEHIREPYHKHANFTLTSRLLMLE